MSRFIAATNKILLAEVGKGHFREDLYYRLQVVAINIPPLRERGDDVFVLTEYFLRKYNARYGRTIQGYESAVAPTCSVRYSWPGNVRELENLLERIFILEDDNRVLVRHMPDRILREVARPGRDTPDRRPLPVADDAGLPLPRRDAGLSAPADRGGARRRGRQHDGGGALLLCLSRARPSPSDAEGRAGHARNRGRRKRRVRIAHRPVCRPHGHFAGDPELTESAGFFAAFAVA